MSVRQLFDTVDVLKLEVEATPAGTVNLVQNPSGELGGWGWVTPVSGSAMESDAPSGFLYLRYAVAGGVPNHFTSEAFAVSPGQFVSARFVLATSYHIRPRVEWLNAAGAVISSSAQGAYASHGLPGSVVTYTSNAAPASTVKARLRIDVYGNTSGGNPAGGSYVRMRQVTVIKTATGTPTVQRKNLCTNPSFETNTNGWSGSGASVARSTAQAHSGAASLAVTASSAVGAVSAVRNVVLDGGADAGGKTFTISAYTRAAADARGVWLAVIFRNSGGTSLSGSGLSQGPGVLNSTTGWTRRDWTLTAPATATSVDVFVAINTGAASEVHYIDAVMVEETSTLGSYFDGSTPDAGGIDYAWTGTAHASISTATSTGSDFGYIEPATYVDVLGPSHSITVKRDELNVGTLTAEIRDATLDPAQFNLIRPGKKTRLLALDDDSGTWVPIFTGRVAQGSTRYDPRRTDNKSAHITLTAVDASAQLAQVKREAGVATIAELPYVLEGAGVPWDVNGSGNQVGTATVVTTNDNATALDQVAITRDSVLGYAWVDRRGVLNAWDNDEIDTTVAGVLDETVYTALDLDYDTARCINVVTVKLRRVNLANGQTVEVVYGPYVDQASVDQWGPHAAEFTVHGITDSDAAASTYADAILAANATPAIRVNQVTFPVAETSHIVEGRALVDLYDLVEVVNENANIGTPGTGAAGMRVTGIEHRITPEKWLVTLDFTVASSVAAPQQTPSLSSPATGNAPTYGAVNFSRNGSGLGTTAPPGPGNYGDAFTVPASGVWHATVHGSGYGSSIGAGAVEIYIDGVFRGQNYMFFNQTNVHVQMQPAIFDLPITAGTHYLWLRRVSPATTDANDGFHLTGPILPA